MALLIEAVEAIPVRALRAKPMVAAGGFGPLAASEFGIVRIQTSDGIEGLGEISMNGGRTGAVQCDDVNRILGPALIGSSPLPYRRHLATMDRLLGGSEPAKAGIEMALIDIVGKVHGIPAFDVLGGRVRESIPVRWGLGFGPPEPGVEEAATYVAQGFRTIKVKVGRPGTGLDEAMVSAVRRGLGDAVNVMVDANAAYTSPLQSVQEIRRLEEFSLQLVEQPLHRSRLAGLALVRSMLRTPVLVDESMRHWMDAYEVARAAAADVLSIYVCESGGMLATQKAAAIGEAAGLPVTIGSQCELGIGTAAMAHVAVTLPNLSYESDITGHLRYPVDIIGESLEYVDGSVRPPERPGLGVTLNEDVLASWRLDR